jgi:hypothetical protein
MQEGQVRSESVGIGGSPCLMLMQASVIGAGRHVTALYRFTACVSHSIELYGVQAQQCTRCTLCEYVGSNNGNTVRQS